MSQYFQNLEEKTKQYFHILSEEIPDFLYDYVETPEMQKQNQISVSCGTVYSKMFQRDWYSSLDHSVGVALIIWHFTKDKKQTLAGLFHDISTPVFKHTIDFMNGDYEKQEFTEGLTNEIIRKSKEIMQYLNKDGIKIEEVDDYHQYPIADNDRPQLASDRLEYIFSDGFGAIANLWNLAEIKEVYENIEVLENEQGMPEIGFRNLEMAERFIEVASKLSLLYNANETIFSMQFLADIVKKMYDKNRITMEDLYQLSEKEMIEKIENCQDDNIAECFKIWRNATAIKESEEKIEGKYCVKIENLKIRYINPLVKIDNKTKRASEISEKAKRDIESALHFKTNKFAYLDFNLE